MPDFKVNPTVNGTSLALAGAPVAWSAITGTPTTLAGYGITDALSSTATQTANRILAGPASGAAAPTYRALVAADLPTILNTTQSVVNAAGNATLNLDGAAANQSLLEFKAGGANAWEFYRNGSGSSGTWGVYDYYTSLTRFQLGADGTAGFNYIASSGFAINSTAFGLLTTMARDIATNTASSVLTVRHNTSGTPASGFGSILGFQLQSSTTVNRDAAQLAASWIVATDASRTARLTLSAVDSAGTREGLRVDSTGSAASLGFYGHAATTQQATAATATDLASVITLANGLKTILTNLGLAT